MTITKAQLAKSTRPVTLADLADFAERTGKALGEALAKRDERIDALVAHVAKAHETNASLERRLSRHAEHLQRVEGRLKALETK